MVNKRSSEVLVLCQKVVCFIKTGSKQIFTIGIIDTLKDVNPQ